MLKPKSRCVEYVGGVEYGKAYVLWCGVRHCLRLVVLSRAKRTSCCVDISKCDSMERLLSGRKL